MKTDFRIQVDAAIDEGLVTKRKHPDERLFILNYSAKCQHEWIWDDITTQCRGLIVDKDYRIIQRPFRKFFNYKQYCELGAKTNELFGVNLNQVEDKPYYNIMDKPGNISIKQDGSLGILYWIKDKPFIATRGSFESDQAILATKLIQSKSPEELSHFDRNLTYLFEIMSPDFRIVVEYPESNIKLIAIINTDTGQDACDIYGELDTELDVTLRSLLEMPQRDDIEGWVIHYPDLNDFRIKFKYDWYLDMHKLLNQLTPKYIWQMYVEDTWKEKVPLLPDELQPDIDSQIAIWKGRYCEIKNEAIKYFDKYKKFAETGRGDFAIIIQQMVSQDYRGMMFKMLDEKSIHGLILGKMKNEKTN